MININLLPSLKEKAIRYYSREIEFSDLPDFFTLTQSDYDKDNTDMYTFTQVEDYENHFLGDNLIEWQALVLDIDNDHEGKKITLLKAHNLLKRLNLNHYIASTHTHSEKKPKFRIIIELDSPVLKSMYEAFSYGIKDTKLYELLKPDDKTLDPARRWVLPPEDCITYSYFEGNALSSIKYSLRGLPLVPVVQEEKPMKIFKNGYVTYIDPDEEKPRKYYEKTIENNIHDFHKGNRDTWINKMIWSLRKKNCSQELMHELLDEYIIQMDRPTQRKFKDKIAGKIN